MSVYTKKLNLLLDSDVYNKEYFLQNDVCRLCWCKNAYNNILNTTENGVRNELIDKINYCLDINITVQSFPNKICDKCHNKIKSMYDFKYFCKQTDIKLKEILNSSGGFPINTDITIEINPADVAVKLENQYISEAETDSSNRIESPKLDAGRNASVRKKKKKCRSKSIRKSSYKPKKGATYCNICHVELGSKEKFTYHNTELHGIEQDGALYKCFGCDKRFKKRNSRLSHEVHYCKALKKGYQCDICNRHLPKRRLYEVHMKSHRENVPIELPDINFKCKKCNEVFDSRDSLKKHMCAVHETKKNFVCESCGRVFTRQDYLHKHKLIHTGVKQHVCPHCGFRATQKSSLTIHIRKHTGERPYSCDVCPQRCTSSSNLRAHRRRHLGLKTYECNICSKKFGYKVSLEEHISSTHEKSEAYPCEDCGAIYTRIRGLRRHLLSKHGKHYKKQNSSVFSVLEEPEHSKISLKTVEDRNIVPEGTVCVKVNERDSLYEVKDEFIVKTQDGVYTLT